MGRRPSFFVTRYDSVGRPWFARKNGFHPNGRLAITWVPVRAYDDQSCIFTRADAVDIKRRQETFGTKAEVRKVGKDGRAITYGSSAKQTFPLTADTG